MDPTIQLLRRDNTVKENPLPSWFVLRYYSLKPMPITILQTNNYDLYGDLELYSTIVAARERFGNIEAKEKVRKLANPFENTPKCFIDRAALKLAGIDAVFELFPKVTNDTLFFADLAGAPGAFSEYIMWRAYRKGRLTKGKAISLATGNQWDLSRSNFLAQGVDIRRLDILYGADGTGNLLLVDNVRDFVARTLQEGTRQLVVADAAIPILGKESQQEQLNSRLLFSEVIIAIQILAQNGTFVLKIWDAYTRYMVDIIHLLARHFISICLYKPLTSRPANSERYIVCKGFRTLLVSVEGLYRVLANENVTSFLEPPPTPVRDYIISMNNYSARAQLQALDWTLEVEKYLAQGYVTVNYPISYDINKLAILWDIPCKATYKQKIVAFPEITVCQELSYSKFVNGLIAKTTALKMDKNIPLWDIHAWLLYASAHGITIGRMDKQLLDTWIQQSPERALLKPILLDYYNITPELEKPCGLLTYGYSQAQDKKIIYATGEDKTNLGSLGVPTSLLLDLLLPSERREYKDRQRETLQKLLKAQVFLERSFILLKRYEILLLYKDDYIVTYPRPVDLELYGTLITVRPTNSGAIASFFSPIHDLEYFFGSVGYPLGVNTLNMNGMVLGLNLLNVKDPILRKELIERLHYLLDTWKDVIAYVATTEDIPTITNSKYITGKVTTKEVMRSIEAKKNMPTVYIYTLSK